MLKGTLLSLMNIGLHKHGLNPITSLNIYRSVVLPKALYGCELWPSLNKNQMQSLEKAHRFCIKFIQNVPPYTRTDICLSLLGVPPLEFEIDYRKLLFFGQLCRLSSNHITIHVFKNRTKSFLNCSTGHITGYFPHIFALLKKYSLDNYLTLFLDTNNFPSNLSWKSVVKKTVLETANREWESRILSDTNLKDFIVIKPRLVHVSKNWELCRSSPESELYNSE